MNGIEYECLFCYSFRNLYTEIIIKLYLLVALCVFNLYVQISYNFLIDIEKNLL